MPEPAAQPKITHAMAPTPELRQLVYQALEGKSRSVVLYGSQARGSARMHSDIDVLQIVESRPRTYTAGRVNISAYHPDTLLAMAQRGSLFVLHLKLDALPLEDHDDTFAKILDAYVSPQSYEPLIAEVRAAASSLWPTSDTEKYRKGLRQLGIYLLRTSVYSTLAERGTPTFEVSAAGDLINDAMVTEALGLRFSDERSGDLDLLREAIARIVGPPDVNRWGSIEALAVAYSDEKPYASSLLAQVIAGHDGALEYTALTPPPL